MAGDRRRIAVVGAGVAGLTAAYVLGRACDVELYEAEDRLGGHAHTHDIADGEGRVVRVDSGFIVHNERTYPMLLRLLRELGVSTQDSEMSMSVRCDGCGLQYAGARGPAGLFARPRHALRGRYLRMLAEIPVFHRRARRALAAGDETLTLGAFGETIDLLEAAGLEVRAVQSLREHYARTIAAWHHTLEERWTGFVALEGEETARVWRLYLAGSSLAFAQWRMGVDQILAVHTTAGGSAGMSATRWYEDAR